MINYESKNPTPPPQFSRFPAQSPYRLPGSHGDVYNMLSTRNQAALNAQRDSMNTDFNNARLAAQRESTLTGLRSLAAAEQDQADLANQNRSMRFNTFNNLLSGLFR